MRLEGRIIVGPLASIMIAALTNRLQGFDEYMNIVMDDATEVYVKGDQPSVPLGELDVFSGSTSDLFQGEFYSKERISL